MHQGCRHTSLTHTHGNPSIAQRPDMRFRSNRRLPIFAKQPKQRHAATATHLAKGISMFERNRWAPSLHWSTTELSVELGLPRSARLRSIRTRQTCCSPIHQTTHNTAMPTTLASRCSSASCLLSSRSCRSCSSRALGRAACRGWLMLYVHTHKQALFVRS